MSIAIWLLGLVALLPQDLPSAESILDKMMVAQTGDRDVSKIETWRYTGRVSFPGMAGLEGRIVEVYGRPLQAYVRTELPTGAMEDGTDGKVCWERNGIQGVTVHEGISAELLRRGYRSKLLRPWRESWKSARVIEKVEIDGRPHFKLELRPEHGAVDLMWVDAETFLPRRVELIAEALPEQEGVRVTIQIRYDDWKSVDGIRYCHRRHIKIGVVELVQELEKVETDVELADGVFALPADVRAALDKVEAPIHDDRSGEDDG